MVELPKTRLPKKFFFSSTSPMTTNKTILISFLFLCAMTGLGCSKKKSSFSDLSSGNGEADTPPSATYLYLHHESTKGALRYTHTTVASGDWTEKCKVDLDAVDPVDRDIMCMTESTELDLMSLGMSLKYNVPAHTKCPYAITMMPFFFQYEPPRNDTVHLEPAFVYVEDDKVAGSYTVTGYYDDPLGATPTANPYLTAKKGGYACGFDYSESDGPNCCEGEYSEITKVTALDGTGTPKDTFTTRLLKWTGDRSNCLEGPAIQNQPKATKNSKWPAINVWRMSEQVDQGSLMQTKKRGMLSPIEVLSDFKSKAETATGSENFGKFKLDKLMGTYATTRFLATHYSNATAPLAFSDILDYSPFASYYAAYGDPRYFTLLCADNAFEIHARIRLSIREWNTYEALLAAAEPGSDEDDNSDPETDYPEFGNNDWLDWEDTDGWMGSVFNTYPGGVL